MTKRRLLVFLLVLLCGVPAMTQSGGTRTTVKPSAPQSPARRPSPQSTTPTGQSGVFQTTTYRVTVDSVHRKANNYTVTLVFENLTDNVVKLSWGGLGQDAQPVLIDEKLNQYSLEGSDSAGIKRCHGCGWMDFFPGTKIKSQFLFFGNGDGTTFTFKANELSPRYNQPVVIKGLRVTSTESFKDVAAFTTESYRVKVDSVKRNEDNVEVILVFESISDATVTLAFGDEGYSETWEVPYLTDENGDKYVLRKLDPSTERHLKYPGINDTDLLPGTKLKADLKFYGTGRGSTFALVSKERSPKYDRPIVIKNLKTDSSDRSRTTQAVENASTITDSASPPTFVTESYRVVVSDVERTGGNIIVTLIFENLLDKNITIAWGSGEVGNDDRLWHGEDPYLIDENADRYYLRSRDDGKVTNCLWCGSAELLPGTKLKTHFIFKDTGNGKTFTFASKEFEPKSDRAIVIKGLAVK